MSTCVVKTYVHECTDGLFTFGTCKRVPCDLGWVALHWHGGMLFLHTHVHPIVERYQGMAYGVCVVGNPQNPCYQVPATVKGCMERCMERCICACTVSLVG